MALRIRSLREAKGLTQLQLGEMAGLSRSQLSEIETETKPANTLRLTAIARALGVQVDELFEESPEDTYRAVILDLMRSMTDDDREAVIRHARALARVK
jgi:transcriptional regulator with XRE-family HTH domain